MLTTSTSTVAGAAEAGPASLAPAWPGRVRAVAPWTLLAAPVVGYFIFIGFFGVNTIVGDQWTDVALLQKVYSGHLSLSALWAAHNENRLLFPNLLVIALAQLDHLDTVTEMYIGAVLLTLTTVLVIATHRRHLDTPLVWYLPVVALLFSLAQYYNTLTGFQLAWYISLAASVATLSLLDGRAETWALVVAAAVAVVASYSTIEGLFVWPAALVLMVLRGRRWQYAVAWAITSLVVTVVYMVGLTSGGGRYSRYDLHHLRVLAGFLLLELGDPSAVNVPSHAGVKAILLMVVGGAVLVVSAYALWRATVRRGEVGPAPFGAALIVMGLVFAVVTALGRAILGFWAAPASRFVTFDVLPIVGCYLVFLGSLRAPTGERTAGGTRARTLVPLLVCALVLVPAVAGAITGIPDGRSTAASDRTASDVIVNVDKASNFYIFDDVYPLFDPRLVRPLVSVARAHRLSLFDSSQVSYYQHLGLVAKLPTASVPGGG